VNDALIVAALAAVVVIAAVLSFVAWHLLGRRPAEPTDRDEPQLDSEDPRV
jgi:hypothetical protein